MVAWLKNAVLESPDQGIALAFACKDWGKPRKNLSGFSGVCLDSNRAPPEYMVRALLLDQPVRWSPLLLTEVPTYFITVVVVIET